MNEIYNIISYIIPITIEQYMYLFTAYGDESMFIVPRDSNYFTWRTVAVEGDQKNLPQSQ